MSFSAVHREARIPDRFLDRGRRPYVRPDGKTLVNWIDLELKPGEIKVSIVRERRFAKLDIAPTLVSTMSEATETASSWYATGNPFPIMELVTFPAAAAGPTSRAQFRRLPLIETIASDLSIRTPTWSSAAPGMLSDQEMPQNRWLQVSLSTLEAWLERWLESSQVIDLGVHVRAPTQAWSHCLYLTHAVGAGGWVKVGKAQDKTASQRMQAQQLCSPYRLQHLGIWSGANAVGGLRAVEAALRKYVARGRETRGEWIKIDACSALELASVFVKQNGLSALWIIE